MPDYDHEIGGGTTLRIRDTGDTVEYWVKTGPLTWNNEQPWSYYVNGTDSPTLYFRMLRGGDWQMFDSFDVSYDQSIRFTIYDSGLGFPTDDYWVHIYRDTVPEAPTIYAADAISSTTIRVKFRDGYEGGSPIIERELGYGLNRDDPVFSQDGEDGTVDNGPWDPGTKVYFWARNRNSTGWSEWSNRGEDTTWRESSPPRVVTFTNVKQTSLTAKFVDRGNGGRPILERQIGYGLSSVSPTSFAGDISGINNITGLSPGKTYYFWARSRNSVGWGAWSARSQVDLVAGARVLVGTTWKRAVPFVKVAGVWKVAQPWVRDSGAWKTPNV
jgi:fibronectin type III domain protein